MGVVGLICICFFLFIVVFIADCQLDEKAGTILFLILFLGIGLVIFDMNASTTKTTVYIKTTDVQKYVKQIECDGKLHLIRKETTKPINKFCMFSNETKYTYIKPLEK